MFFNVELISFNEAPPPDANCDVAGAVEGGVVEVAVDEASDI